MNASRIVFDNVKLDADGIQLASNNVGNTYRQGKICYADRRSRGSQWRVITKIVFFRNRPLSPRPVVHIIVIRVFMSGRYWSNLKLNLCSCSICCPFTITIYRIRTGSSSFVTYYPFAILILKPTIFKVFSIPSGEGPGGIHSSIFTGGRVCGLQAKSIDDRLRLCRRSRGPRGGRS